MNTCTIEAEVGNKNRFQRSCVDCHTTRTPLWRGGPAGARSLCNACGIRYRKQNRGLLALAAKEEDRNKRKNIAGRDKKLMRMVLGKEWKRKLREEEEAAILLMALSVCS